MDDAEEQVGIVYVLTNDAMPHMVKIGRKSGDGVERRVAELSRATGIPLPFKVAIARTVHDARVVERALHIAFGPDRVKPRAGVLQHRAGARHWVLSKQLHWSQPRRVPAPLTCSSAGKRSRIRKWAEEVRRTDSGSGMHDTP